MSQDYEELTAEGIDLPSILVEEDELRPIPMEYLYEGMEVVEDIYNYDGTLLLVPKGSTLSASALTKLKRFNTDSRNISVNVTTYNMLMGRGAPPIRREQSGIERATGYGNISDGAVDMLAGVQQGEAPSAEHSLTVTADMSERLRSIDPAFILQCINSPKPVDEYLGRHCANVALLNGFMGRWLELPQEDIDELILVGLVHDIGKTKIPTEILEAPRALTISEFEVMKMHPIYSYELLGQDDKFSEAVRLGVRHHHERMNGSGYPDGIDISQISLFARITAVSDIYDAMVSRHRYKEATNPFLIFSQLAGSRFSELDTKLIKVFTDNMPNQLIGKQVRMSDGSIGVVRFIMNDDLEYPLVEVEGKMIKTDESLYCQSLIFE